MTEVLSLPQMVGRKLLTKPIWLWESRRKHPLRDRVFELPPWPVNPDPQTVLAILTPPENVQDAVWAARSFFAHLPKDMGFVLVVNGELDNATAEAVDTRFPGIIRLPVGDFRDKTRLPGNVGKFVDNNPLGHKLSMILLLQKRFNIVFCDFDVLAFNPMPELCEAIDAQGPPLYIQDVAELTADSTLLERIKALGYGYADTLNGGFHFIPRESLSLNLADDLLAPGGYNEKSWHTDQTLLAALMTKAGARPLPKARYVVSTDRQFFFEEDIPYDQIAVRHFIGPVRHLMYSRGLPRLWKSWSKPS